MLVAIAIPIFTTQLEKSREATDASNIRAAYAEIIADALGGEDMSDMSKYTVKLKQQQAKWQNSFDFPENLTAGTTEPANNGQVTFTYDETDGVGCDITLTKGA